MRLGRMRSPSPASWVVVEAYTGVCMPAGRRLAKRLRALLPALCLLASFTSSLLAQNGPDNDSDVAAGLANSVFENGQVDSINLYNGQLTVPIPLGPSYPIGPKLRMQLVLSYTSRVDDFGHPAQQSPDFFYKPLVGC